MWQTYAMQTWQTCKTCKTCYVSCKMCLWIPLSLGNRVASNLSKAFYLLTVHQPIALATFLSSESNSRSEREPKGHRMRLARGLSKAIKMHLSPPHHTRWHHCHHWMLATKGIRLGSKSYLGNVEPAKRLSKRKFGSQLHRAARQTIRSPPLYLCWSIAMMSLMFVNELSKVFT